MVGWKDADGSGRGLFNVILQHLREVNEVCLSHKSRSSGGDSNSKPPEYQKSRG
jgi:hypothetical protein